VGAARLHTTPRKRLQWPTPGRRWGLTLFLKEVSEGTEHGARPRGKAKGQESTRVVKSSLAAEGNALSSSSDVQLFCVCWWKLYALAHRRSHHSGNFHGEFLELLCGVICIIMDSIVTQPSMSTAQNKRIAFVFVSLHFCLACISWL
jgi:hypothetical protein